MSNQTILQLKVKSILINDFCSCTEKKEQAKLPKEKNEFKSLNEIKQMLGRSHHEKYTKTIHETIIRTFLEIYKENRMLQKRMDQSRLFSPSCPISVFLDAGNSKTLDNFIRLGNSKRPATPTSIERWNKLGIEIDQRRLKIASEKIRKTVTQQKFKDRSIRILHGQFVCGRQRIAILRNMDNDTTPHTKTNKQDSIETIRDEASDKEIEICRFCHEHIRDLRHPLFWCPVAEFVKTIINHICHLSIHRNIPTTINGLLLLDYDDPQTETKNEKSTPADITLATLTVIYANTCHKVYYATKPISETNIIDMISKSISETSLLTKHNNSVHKILFHQQMMPRTIRPRGVTSLNTLVSEERQENHRNTSKLEDKYEKIRRETIEREKLNEFWGIDIIDQL